MSARYFAIGYDDIGRVVDSGSPRTSQSVAVKDGTRLTRNRRVASVSIVKVDTHKPRRNPETVASAIVAATPAPAPVTNPYHRKTEDEWEIQGHYGGRTGWEVVSTEDTRKEALRCLRDYNENERQYPHRIVKRRVKIV